MHDLRSKFYAALWGDSQLYRSIWYGKKGEPPYKSKWFTDTSQALAFADTLNISKQYNVYHSCSLFNKESRKQQDVELVKALWVDVDLKKTDYATVKEMALAYLPRFHSSPPWNDFWVVMTGNGLHVYWMFKEPVDKKTWLDLAKHLPDFCKLREIPHERTTDSASLLRVPGSWNIKGDEPKEVKIILEGNLIDRFAESPQNDGLKVDKTINYTKDDFNLNEALSTVTQVESDANSVADKCALIKQFRQDGLDDSEPLWHFALGVVHNCIDGDKYAHEFSSKSPRYNEEETNRKLTAIESNDVGPCLCETFESHGCTYCEHCAHKGKIKSPIQLGAISQAIDDPLTDIDNEKQKKRAQEFIALAPSKGWSIEKKGIYKIVDGEKEIVTTTPFYVIDKICEDAKDYTIITALIRAYTDTGIITFKLPLKTIAEDRKLIGEFYARGIFLYNKKFFSHYITAYMQKISHIKSTKAIRSLGWQEDNSFAFGSDGSSYDSKGEYFTSTIDSNAIDFLNGFESKGRLPIWRKAAELYNTSPFFYPHMLSILCSLGSPLLPMTGVTGFILSLQGETGSGKSLSQELAMSVWGNHLLAGCIGVKDSEISMLERLAKLKNLPARIDEAIKLSDAQLSGLIYGLVNGRGRAKCTKDSSLASTAYGWQTLTLVSTNRPLLEHDVAQITEAERHRILELAVKMPPNMIDIGGQIGDIMKSNYGVAGKKFIKWVIHNKEDTQMILDTYFTKLKSYVDDSKRFWVSCGAIAFTAAQIAKKIDLFAVDIDAMYTWFVTTLKNQSSVNEKYLLESRGFESKEELIDALRDHLGGHILTMNENGTTIIEPTREVKAMIKQFDSGASKMYIRGPILNDFIKTHFTDSINKVKTDLEIGDSKSLRVGSRAGRFYVFNLTTS